MSVNETDMIVWNKNENSGLRFLSASKKVHTKVLIQKCPRIANFNRKLMGFTSPCHYYTWVPPPPPPPPWDIWGGGVRIQGPSYKFWLFSVLKAFASSLHICSCTWLYMSVYMAFNLFDKHSIKFFGGLFVQKMTENRHLIWWVAHLWVLPLIKDHPTVLEFLFQSENRKSQTIIIIIIISVTIILGMSKRSFPKEEIIRRINISTKTFLFDYVLPPINWPL